MGESTGTGVGVAGGASARGVAVGDDGGVTVERGDCSPAVTGVGVASSVEHAAKTIVPITSIADRIERWKCLVIWLSCLGRALPALDRARFRRRVRLRCWIDCNRCRLAVLQSDWCAAWALVGPWGMELLLE